MLSKAAVVTWPEVTNSTCSVAHSSLELGVTSGFDKR